VIKNNTQETIPAGKLELKPNSYFTYSTCQVPAIPANGEVTVELTSYVSGSKLIRDISKIIELSFFGVKETFNETVWSYIGDVNKYDPSPLSRFNILLFGLAGATKSSFVNSVSTLFNYDRTLTVRAEVGGGGQHTTQALTRYDLPKSKISLWDTWGLTTKTYSNDDLDMILEGVLPSNWKMDYTYDVFKKKLEDNKLSRVEREIHSVLFFIPHSSLDKKDEVDIIKTNFAKIQHKAQLNPILLLTKTDEVDAKLREDPWIRSKEIVSMITKASNILGIPENRIFTNINYTKEKEKSFNLDRNTYEIIMEAIRTASSNARKKKNYNYTEGDDLIF